MKLFNGFKFFLNPLWVTDTFLTTSIFGAISGAIGIASSLFGGGGSSAGNTAGGAVYDPFQKYRKQYAGQLQNLMQNPGQIKQDPGYQFMFGQGQEALNRTVAETGQRFSGGHDVALQNYGQGFAHDWYNEKLGNLMSLSGASSPMMDVSGQNKLNVAQNQLGWQGVAQGIQGFGSSNVGQTVGSFLTNLF